jgi:hypothetical protein
MNICRHRAPTQCAVLQAGNASKRDDHYGDCTRDDDSQDHSLVYLKKVRPSASFLCDAQRLLMAV